jgi:hypothetical protein
MLSVTDSAREALKKLSEKAENVPAFSIVMSGYG